MPAVFAFSLNFDLLSKAFFFGRRGGEDGIFF